MNEIDEAIVSTRKKKRRSGFRFSSKKVLQRSRVRREISKDGGIMVESVRKALSFPSEIVVTDPHDCAPGSNIQPCLDIVEERSGDGEELTCCQAISTDRCIEKVSFMSVFDELINPELDCIVGCSSFIH